MSETEKLRILISRLRKAIRAEEAEMINQVWKEARKLCWNACSSKSINDYDSLMKKAENILDAN